MFVYTNTWFFSWFYNQPMLGYAIVVGVNAVVFVAVAAFASACERFSSCWRPNLSWWWVKESLVRIIGKWWTSSKREREKSVDDDEDWDFVLSFTQSLYFCSYYSHSFSSHSSLTHTHTQHIYSPSSFCHRFCVPLSFSCRSQYKYEYVSVDTINSSIQRFRNLYFTFSLEVAFLLFHSPFAIAKPCRAKPYIYTFWMDGWMGVWMNVYVYRNSFA